MARTASGRGGAQKIEQFMGSTQARQAVSGAELDLIEDGDLPSSTADEPKPSRTRREGSKEKDTSKETFSKSDSGDWVETEKRGNFLTGFGDAVGQGVGMGGDMNYGSMNSPMAKEWGVNTSSIDDALNNPMLMFDLFDENVGASPHMDASDMQMFGNHSYLESLADPSLAASSFDRTAARASNAQTPGGNFQTMGDVMGWIDSARGTPGEAEINQYDAGRLNNILIGSVQNSYPGMILNAVDNMLSEAARDYEVAVATGYMGTYLEFLEENGTAEYLRGM